MSANPQPAKPPRLLNAFVMAGDLLWLQLLFVVASLPLVTVFPAALALQRSLREVLLDELPRPTAVFCRNLAWAWRRAWKVALLPPALLAMAFFSLSFWIAASNGVGITAVFILVPLYGIALAVYLAVLAGAMTVSLKAPLREWGTAALGLSRRRPLQLGLSVVVMATWFLLLARLPTLMLIGTGLIPAALAWWTARPWIEQYRQENLSLTGA